MAKILLFHLIAAVLSLGVLGLSPAHAKQNTICRCLTAENNPCTCSNNWAISPLATHTYYAACYEIPAEAEARSQSPDIAREDVGYYWSFSVNGRNKNTTCTVTNTDPGWLLESRACTNWSLIKKDGTSTVVKCGKH